MAKTATATATPDFIVYGGSIWSVVSMHAEAIQFSRDEINLESWQWQGAMFHVDPRYGADLVELLRDDGWIVEEG